MASERSGILNRFRRFSSGTKSRRDKKKKSSAEGQRFPPDARRGPDLYPETRVGSFKIYRPRMLQDGGSHGNGDSSRSARRATMANFNVSQTYLPRDQHKVCVVSNKQQYLDAAVKTIQACVSRDQQDRPLGVVTKRIRTGQAEELDNFEEAGLVLLVAVAAGRMLIVSDVEESQLGVAYGEAKKVRACTAMILTEHSGSSSLPDNELYPDRLQDLFRNQPALGDMARRDRFISLPPAPNNDLLNLNTAQRAALTTWLKESRPGATHGVNGHEDQF